MFLQKPQLVKVEPHVRLAMFGNPPGFVPLKQPDLFSFDGPLVYQFAAIGKYPAGTFTVPKGVTTDFASSPKVLEWVPFLDINGDSRLAGGGHDAAYRLGRERGKDFVDGLLYQMCIDCGLKKWQAGAYFKAVQWFGASAWDGDGKMANYGGAQAKFVAKADYDAWVAAGSPFYS
jgi:hypothetical protein